MKSLNINTAKHNNIGSAKTYLSKMFLIQNSSVISPLPMPAITLHGISKRTFYRILVFARFPYASSLKRSESLGKFVREYSILIKMLFLARFLWSPKGKYVCYSTASIKFHPDFQAKHQCN